MTKDWHDPYLYFGLGEFPYRAVSELPRPGTSDQSTSLHQASLRTRRVTKLRQLRPQSWASVSCTPQSLVQRPQSLVLSSQSSVHSR